MNSSPGYLFKEKETLSQKDRGTPMVTAAVFTIVKIEKQPKCPSVDEWIKTVSYIYICVCVCMCMCVYIYMCVCVGIHTHIYCTHIYIGLP